MKPREFQQRLKNRARRVGLALAPEVSEKLEDYYALLTRWNAKMNLTALALDGAPDSTLDRLIIEPLIAARYLPAGMLTVVDIGSGGGSPAIPMKLAVSDVSLIMVESKGRKAAFLREAVRTLQLGHAVVETARFEELLPRADLHEAAHVLTLRAVRVEARVLMTLQAFVRPGGAIFLFRGPSGPDVPSTPTPPLSWKATYPLVDALHSRLVVMSKTDVGKGNRGNR